MTVLTASEARRRFFRLFEELAASHEPLLVTGKHGNLVILTDQDWRDIQETLYLSSIPGMVDSIKEGMATPTEEMSRELDW